MPAHIESSKAKGKRSARKSSIGMIKLDPLSKHEHTDPDDELMSSVEKLRPKRGERLRLQTPASSDGVRVKEEDDEEEEDDEDDEDYDSEHDQDSEQEEHNEPPAFSLATLGLQRVGTAPPPKPKVSKAPILTLNARGMPARIRKRNPFFFDDNIINDDKPLRMSLSPKKLPMRHLAGGPGMSATKGQKTPAKVLKKRRGVVSRYMRSSGGSAASSTSNTTHTTNTYGNSTLAASKLGRGKGPGGKLTPGKAASAGKTTGSASKTGPGRGHGKVHGNTGKLTGGAKGRRVSGMNAAGSHSKGAGAAGMAAGTDRDTIKTEEQAVANKRLCQTIGLRLRNLLKLPKAHKWAIAEWFYSYVDKPLFNCRDDFMHCLNDLVPDLTTRQLNRHEWGMIRRRMGKPRRCSANFFNEERRELERKRQLIRTLQSRKPGDLKDAQLLIDMPEKIPMPLPLGTKVTARLRQPQDGIFSGNVAAYDSVNAMYRVTFERSGLGTHSIPDYEIVSENFHEMLPLHSFTKDFRPNLINVYQGNNYVSNVGFTTNLGYTTNLASSKRALHNNNGGVDPDVSNKHLANNNAAARNALSIQLNKSDPLLGQDAITGDSPLKPQVSRNVPFSTHLLHQLVRLGNFITQKNDRINRLNEMNGHLELTMMTKEEMNEHFNAQQYTEFQRRYASNVISIERINVELLMALAKVQEYSKSLTSNAEQQAMISPTYLREECRAKAGKVVDDLNNGMVRNTRMIKLLKNLTTLLMVTQNMGAHDCKSEEVKKVLEGCMEEVRTNLVLADNVDVFQKCVQAPLQYIAVDINRNVDEHKSESAKSPKSPKQAKSLKLEIEDDENKEAVSTNETEEEHKVETEDEEADDTETKIKLVKELCVEPDLEAEHVQKLEQESADEKDDTSQLIEETSQASEEAKAITEESVEHMEIESIEHIDDELKPVDKIEDDPVDQDDDDDTKTIVELSNVVDGCTDDTQITIESIKESDEDDPDKIIKIVTMQVDDPNEDYQQQEYLFEK